MHTPLRLSLLTAGLICAAPALRADSFTTTTSYAILTTGVYQVTAAGAAGEAFEGSAGGEGAVLSGEFSFTAGTVLEFQIGQTSTSFSDGGIGGGGTVILVQGASSPLLDAGGGGGATVGGEVGGNAQLTTSGGAGFTGGGSNGSNGGAAVYETGIMGDTGAGGGGFYGSGSTVGGASSGGQGGGGGGYSGGGGAFYGGGGTSVSGGGGSFSAASVTDLSEAVSNTGSGYVDISLETPPVAPTPEPSSLLLLATGALGIGGALRRRVQPLRRRI